MKKIVLFTALLSLMIFTGCSEKQDVQTPKVATSDSSSVQSPHGVSSAHMGGVSQVDAQEKIISMLESKMGSIYFAFDKYSIGMNQESAIYSNAAILNSIEASNYSVKIEGNCDEWGTDEYNYALGLKRAKSAKDALVAHGVDANRIVIVSYGESNPACSEKMKSCWSKNRRAEFKLLP